MHLRNTHVYFCEYIFQKTIWKNIPFEVIIKTNKINQRRYCKLMKKVIHVSCCFRNNKRFCTSKASRSTFRKHKVSDMLWSISDKNRKGWTVYVSPWALQFLISLFISVSLFLSGVAQPQTHLYSDLEQEWVFDHCCTTFILS